MILLTIFFVRDSHSFTVSPMFTPYTGYLFAPTVKAIWFSTDKHLSDMWLSTLEIGDAQLCSVAQIAPISPFLCVNRSVDTALITDTEKRNKLLYLLVTEHALNTSHMTHVNSSLMVIIFSLRVK